MGEFLRDLMKPNTEEVSSVGIESDVNDKLLGVNIETFLHEVSQCHQKIEEYEGNLVQIERLQTNIWKGLKWGLEQRRKMSEEIGEKSARNRQIHTEVRKVRIRYHKIICRVAGKCVKYETAELIFFLVSSLNYLEIIKCRQTVHHRFCQS